MGALAEILERKREEFRELRRRALPATELRPRSFSLARAPGAPLGLIAEIKRRSPSAGALSKALGVGERAAAYERGGASMLSVLTDERYFDGSFEHLTLARHASRLPVLCKEFVLDEVQLDWARASGADAVLLIVRCLGPDELARLFGAARERGLAPLVEVASEEEARVALDVGAELIGVNARDLDTLAMDPARAERVLAGLPESVTRVHLSGVRSAPDVQALAQSAADAALVGEALMRLDDPTELLRDFARAAIVR